MQNKTHGKTTGGLRGARANRVDRRLFLTRLAALGGTVVSVPGLNRAIEFYLKAVVRLPEYVAAHFTLAVAYRRTGRPADAVPHLRETLLNSCTFYGGSFWQNTWLPGNEMRNDWERKSLLWLQRSNKRPEDLADDPFLRVVDDLRFETGVKESRDFTILRSLIDEYVERNQALEAVRLWSRLGE